MQDQLAAVTDDLHRLSGLVGVGHDIAKAKAELEKQRGETERVSTALASLRRQQSEEAHKLQALQNETSRLTSLRREYETAIGHLKKMIGV